MLPDKADFATFGGSKADYTQPEDPTTDRAAGEVDEAFADVAAMTRTAPRAYVAFTAAGVVSEHDAVWGNTTDVLPVVTVNGTGDFTVTWPSTVTDALGVEHGVNLRRGWGNAEDAGYLLNVKRTSSNAVRVWCLAGIFADPPGDMVVWMT